MKSPFSFIVEPYNGRRYDNIKKIGDVNLIISSSKEDHTVSNRFAKVISTPINYEGEIIPGDILLVHHNVFKFYNDMKGVEKSGKSFFKDNLFFIDYDQFFMYKHKDKWNCHSKYVMIKPSLKIESDIKTSNVEEPLIGVIKYINDELKSKGLKEGDKISYEPSSEYPFMVEGEKLYRMFTSNIKLLL
jgi:hypothetical protein|tara:strand:+ start:4038 stop:4601 length:564 start_codon:yes stop_codon:yes gene_type:complete